jgi:surfeit locus 1 family protein
MTAERARRLPIGLTLAVAVVLAILVGLGSWQVSRLRWKTDLLARIDALQSAPARDAGTVLAAGGGDFTRVRMTCPGLATAPYLQLYGLRDGQAGTRLISACPVDAGPYRSVLVDRGFVAQEISARPSVDPSRREPVELVGVLRTPDKASFVTPPNDTAANRWYARDVAQMAGVLGAAAPAPLMLMAETSSNPEWRALIPAPVPVDIPNRHLEYAGTWFGLAAALVGVYAALLWRRWKS